MSELVMPFVAAFGGITFGSILNYFIFKRLFARQAKGTLEQFMEMEMTKEVAEMVHQVHEWSKTEEAKVMFRSAYKSLFGEEVEG